MTSKSTCCDGVIEECGEIFNRLGSKLLLVKDAELIRAKSFGIAAVAYFFNNLVHCEYHD